MSTNYYMMKKCACCGDKKQIHLGKSSFGWTFIFRGDREIGVIDFNTWNIRIKTLLQAGWSLVDEYEQTTDYRKFIELVISKITEKQNQAREFPGPNDWLSEGGDSFSDKEFS